MLDLDHPQTQYIFRASGLLDGLLLADQKMCRVGDEERLEIFADCQNVLAQLRELNRAHFTNSAFIATAIDELEAALQQLSLPDADREKNTETFASNDPCARCGRPLKRFQSWGNLDSASRLMDEMMEILHKTRDVEQPAKREKNSSPDDSAADSEFTLDFLKKTQREVVYCPICSKIPEPARAKLDGFEGFGTMAI